MADPKTLAARFYSEVFSKGDMAVLDELVDDALVEHEELPGITPDKAGLVEFVRSTRESFSDFSAEVVAMVQEGDEVWVQGLMRGTQTGEFLGIPATGRPIEVGFFDRVRVRDGRAVEHWGLTDTMALMQQLGVIDS
jgi:steroid delta-isomerase-like uncharacterized protein